MGHNSLIKAKQKLSAKMYRRGKRIVPAKKRFGRTLHPAIEI